ncbi:MAG: hypothetical protein ABIS67_10275 [Candidatus Eisenbacteria bacterium]
MRAISHRIQCRYNSLPPYLLAFLCFVLGVAPASAGFQVWTGTAPRAKSLEAIARDPLNPNRFWAAAFGSGVFRTTDGGATWTSYRTGLVNTFVRCLAVQPNHSDSLYCGTNDGVFISVNGGVSWNKLLSTSMSVRSLTIHPIRTGTLYAGTYGSGVYKSLNAGQSWAQINLGLVNTSVRDVALHPTKPETLLVATGTGGGIHRSYNGGFTWAQVPDTTATLGAAEQIRWDVLNPLRIYVAELERGVLKSSDGGNTWVRINRGLTTLRCRSLAVVDTLRYAGTDGQGVFFTTLNDTMWHPINTGITSLVVDALSTTATTPSTCWAGTDGGGIFATTDRGANWAQMDGGLLNTFGFSLAVRPSSHRLYAGMGFGDQFWSSPDQGSTWTRASVLTSHNSEHGVVPDPLDASTVFMTSYGSGVYRSDDDGLTWTKPDIGLTLTNSFVRDIVAWPGQSGHLFVGSGNGVFESTDGASSWTSRAGNLPASKSVRALALVPGSPPTLYLGSDSTGVWRSTDGGATWAQQNTGMPAIPVLFIHSLLVDATSSATVYAATDSGVYKSTNGGDTWAPARTGLPPGDVVALAQDSRSPQALFCAIRLAGVFESLDGGATWSALFAQSGLTNLRMRSLAVDGGLNTIYAGTDNGVAALTGYPGSTVGVEIEPPAAAGLRAWPNPLRAGFLRVRLAVAHAARVRVAVFDVSGARLRTLGDRLESAGMREWSWDARDDAGRLVHPGLYFLRVDGPGVADTRRIVVLGR